MSRLKVSMDADGYPTDRFLSAIRNAPSIKRSDAMKLMGVIREAWAYADWGWSEQKIIDRPDHEVMEYNISTAGWSGNESLIRALQKNKNFFWTIYWYQSRAGGHYIFRIPLKEPEPIKP